MRRALTLAFAVAAAACAEPSPAARARVPIVLRTTEGAVHCELDRAAAPQSVAMFLGLADGSAPHVDPATGETVHTPLYRDLAIFRAIRGAYVQTGCPRGDGSGSAGRRVSVEPSPSDRRRLARRGALFLARYQPPPNRADPHPPPPGDTIGSQFVVGLTDMSHLAGEVTVLGHCDDLDVVGRIADRVASGDRSERLVSIDRE